MLCCCSSESGIGAAQPPQHSFIPIRCCLFVSVRTPPPLIPVFQPAPLCCSQTAINYLAIPAILAMVAYAAVSFPEQTANTTYTVLEFIKEHPTASSIGIVVGAGALLGPDLLAGTAVAGGWVGCVRV